MRGLGYERLLITRNRLMTRMLYYLRLLVKSDLLVCLSLIRFGLHRSLNGRSMVNVGLGDIYLAPMRMPKRRVAISIQY